MSSDMQGLGPRVRAHTARQPGAVLADAFATLAGRIGDRRIRFAARRTHPLLLLVVLVASGLAHAPVHAQTFAPALNVSNTRADSFSPQMAVVSPHVYVAWLEGKSLFSRSTNSGQSFSAPVQIIPAFASMQRIAATGSNVYVAYSGRPKPKQPSQVYFKRSTDNGASFGNQVQASGGLDASLQAMAISGSNVYLVWQQWDGNNWDVFFARSTDCGATFGSPVNLSHSSRAIGSGSVALAAEGPGVQVAWSEKVGGGGGTDEILYRGSTDGGASFGSVLNIANGAAANSVMPAISVSGAYVYLAWREAGIRFAASADGGATFTAPVDLSPGWADTRGIAGGPKLAASGTAVQVIWLSDSPGNYELFHRASTDGGASFNAERNLSISALDSSDAVVAADGADVYAVWRDALPSGEIFLVHSTDDGATFGAAVNVSNSAGDSGGPQLAIASPTEIYAIWSDRTPGNSDVFFARGMLP